MMLRRMQLSEEISIVSITRGPSNDELSLVNAIFCPMEPHVHCLGALGLHCPVGETNSALIIGRDDSGLLGEAKVGKRLPGLHGFFAGFEDSGPLRFAGRAGDDVGATAHHVDKPVGGGFALVTL